MKCCILSCKNYSDKRSEDGNDITFHLFPADENQRRKWIKKINRQNWTPTKFTKICSFHFNQNDFRLTKKGLKKLKKGSLPCLKLRNNLPEHTEPSTEPLPESETSNLNEYLILHDTPRERHLKYEVTHLRYKAKKDKLAIRRLQMRLKRLKNKVQHLTALVEECENKHFLLGDQSEILSALNVRLNDLVGHQLSNNRVPLKKKYSPALRSFALTLNCVSPKAYSYIRKTFDTHLPTQGTIYKWYEEGEGGSTVEAFNTIKHEFSSSDSTMTIQRLAALRALMANQPKALSAYIVPTADAHNSEYISPADARREWLSGFTGSAGTAVVTTSTALVWTDGRYYTQFERETDPNHWTLMKQSLPDTPSMEKWLATNLQEGAIVGADPTTMRRDDWTPLKTALTRANMELIPIQNNLVDDVRFSLDDPPPPRESNPLLPLPLKYTGKTAGEKVTELREKIKEKKASALVITALDEIAYTLNLRGSDIDYNPVFFAYLVIRPQSSVLFWNDGELLPEIINHFNEEQLNNVSAMPYGQVFQYLRDLAKELSQMGDGKHSIWLSHDGSEAIHTAAAGGDSVKKPLTLLSEVSPVALAKLVKNKLELKGFRDCHVRDGIAVIRFFRWLHEELNLDHNITEVQAADKLLAFRKEEADFMGPSFETIAGVGPNGAIIHYSPSRTGPQTNVDRNQFLLLDSGGQYRDGTTDITRTRHMSGAATSEQRAAFTRVLKGQIAVATALFPKGVKGNVLDSFARKALWEVGLDYAHGTGHGVGHFLNVHEGPSGVSWRPYPDDPGLKPGIVLSNEPGYYKVGEYGIRHEDLVEVIEVTKNSKHPRAAGLVGDYDGRGVLGFNTLTMVPNQRSSIDVDLLDDFELAYINSYHKCVLETVGPVLKQRGLMQDLEWLENECQPISRT